MELIIVLVVVLLLFGSSRLPKLARSMGEASREFKAGIDQGKAQDGDRDAPAPAGDEQVTMTRAQLEAMLAEREAAGRRASAPPGAAPPPAPGPIASDTPPSPPPS